MGRKLWSTVPDNHEQFIPKWEAFLVVREKEQEFNVEQKQSNDRKIEQQINLKLRESDTVLVKAGKMEGVDKE